MNSKINDLKKAFRESRNQVLQEIKVEKAKPNNRKIKNRNISSDPYKNFLDKYDDLENGIKEFKTQDLVYFFREKAGEKGIKYVIANMKRDMGIFKKLQTNYSIEEICLMIEFIFDSDQNYLDIHNTQPTVLASGWCNTLYRDSKMWVEDKFSPKPKNSREWSGDIDTRVTIGEWE